MTRVPFVAGWCGVLRRLVVLSLWPMAMGMAMAQTSPAASALLAPGGTLRAAINLGNPILARRDPASGLPMGVSVDLAQQLAQRLGVPLQLVVLDAAGKAVQAVTQDQADIGFFALDPQRAQGVSFSGAYVQIEGSYLVRQDSPLQRNEEVDAAAHRVVVGQGSAYDLFLSRHLQHAQIVRAPTSPQVVDFFLAQHMEVAAGVKQQLQADALRVPGVRLLPGRFMVIDQAMGLPKARGQAATDVLTQFVQEMKTSGFVAQALWRHRVDGASVAP